MEDVNDLFLEMLEIEEEADREINKKLLGEYTDGLGITIIPFVFIYVVVIIYIILLAYVCEPILHWGQIFVDKPILIVLPGGIPGLLVYFKNRKNKIKRYYVQFQDGTVSFLCKRDGFKFKSCPNNDNGLCRTRFDGVPKSQLHKFDGINIINCYEG